ncbi:MAG: enoyl-CoA hydratase/isomerase family protein, partial [Gaiellaceae bacterium]
MIGLTIADAVATVTLNAPERLNALGPDDLRELDAAYRDAEAAGVRALV